MSIPSLRRAGLPHPDEFDSYRQWRDFCRLIAHERWMRQRRRQGWLALFLWAASFGVALLWYYVA